MNKLFKRNGVLFALAALVGSSVFFQAPFAFAAEPAPAQEERITLSPTSLRASYDAGTSQSGMFTIINDGQIGYNFSVYTRPYSVQNDAYEPDFNATGPRADLYRWVQFAKSTYKIEAGQRIEVPYKITIPKDAAPGGHYGVLFAETQPQEPATDAVLRKKRVGMIVYATVNGDVKREASVAASTTNFFQFIPPITSNVRVENTGNTDAVASVTYTVRDIFGNQKFQSARDYSTLPETTRSIDLTWDNSPYFGLYRTSTNVSLLGNQTNTSAYVLLVPKWAWTGLLVLIIGGILYAAISRRRAAIQKKRKS